MRMVRLLIRLLGMLFRREKKTHKWRKAQAREMIRDFQSTEIDPVRIYKRIRAMDPLAFEELVMEALECRGLKVKRSKRYSGDGGLDGEFHNNGKWVILQMKRYKGSIQKSHVRDFAALCERRGQEGLFVHSGTTNGPTKELFKNDTNIDVISGKRLVALLTGERVDFK